MVLVAAAAGVVAAHHARQRQMERSLAEILRDPRPLWYNQPDLFQPVWLMFVYVDSLSLVPKLANTRMQIRVRYGGSGRFMEKYSSKVRTAVVEGSEQVSGKFEAMFLFPWSADLQPILALDLVKLGFMDWNISEAVMRIPFGPNNPGALEHDLLFFGKRGEDGFIGQVNLFLEVKAVTLAEVEQGEAPLVALGSSWQPGMQVMTGSAVVQGRPVRAQPGARDIDFPQGDALR